MTEIPYMRKWLTIILPSRLLKADLGGELQSATEYMIILTSLTLMTFQTSSY